MGPSIDGSVQSDITEWSMIDKPMVVVITTPAHEAFISPVRLPPLIRYSKLTKVPIIFGVYDQTLRSYSDFLLDDDNDDPWFEKMRGIGPLSSSVSLFCSPFKVELTNSWIGSRSRSSGDGVN